MRILLVGCVKSSQIFLEKLIEIEANLVGVVTKCESEYNADFVDLGELCRKCNIDYIYTKHINDTSAKEYIKSKNVDLLLCLGWSQLLDREVLSIPKVGCIGFHPAELPYNRGRHPLIWALALGLKRTASTLYLMDAMADTGPIISQCSVKIDYSDDAMTLYDKVMLVAEKQLQEVLQDFQNNTVKLCRQSLDLGNTWRKRSKEDGKIDWRMSSRNIYNLVRALTKPYPGAHFLYCGREYKVWRVRELLEDKYENIEPGKIIKVLSNSRFVVKTGVNCIEVLECETIELSEGEYL